MIIILVTNQNYTAIGKTRRAIKTCLIIRRVLCRVVSATLRPSPLRSTGRGMYLLTRAAESEGSKRRVLDSRYESGAETRLHIVR